MADGDRCAMRPGDDEVAAFLDAVMQCRSQLIRHVGYLCGSWEDAEDIVQVSLMKAYSNLHQFRGEAQMTTWLRSIARNAALEYARNHRGRFFVSLDLGWDDGEESPMAELQDTKPTPEEWCVEREMAELLRREVGRLSAYSRGAIEMCSLEEIPHAEAAALMKVTVSSMKSRVFRGKQVLQREIWRHVREVCDGNPVACGR